jgi:signal transduction histidine kinase
MAGGLAQEINTPLMNMINFSDMIRDRLEKVSCHDHAIDQVKAFAGEIKDEGERIMGIVKNLLAFSHQENESEGMIGMREMIHGLISLIGRLLDKDGIDLTVDISPDLPAILCRPRQIQQALLNLVTNARDALNDRFVGTHPDKKLRILVTSALMDDRIWVRTSIKDHGTGIAKEIQSRVFVPFFTTRPEGKGIGLGLAISYSIIHDHGGSIEIESSEAGPTYFHVWLPAGKERTETLHAG